MKYDRAKQRHSTIIHVNITPASLFRFPGLDSSAPVTWDVRWYDPDVLAVGRGTAAFRRIAQPCVCKCDGLSRMWLLSGQARVVQDHARHSDVDIVDRAGYPESSCDTPRVIWRAVVSFGVLCSSFLGRIRCLSRSMLCKLLCVGFVIRERFVMRATLHVGQHRDPSTHPNQPSPPRPNKTHSVQCS